MTNNDIVNSIRSRNLPVKIAFNNQHTLTDLAARISNQIEADSTALITAFFILSDSNKTVSPLRFTTYRLSFSAILKM